MSVINGLIGQTHSPASSDHYFHLNFVFLKLEKWVRTYRHHVWKQWSLPAITVDRPCGSKGFINFHREKKWPYGINATDYQRWYSASQPYVVQWSKGYEPYLLVRMKNLPPFYEDFVGYGFNKVSHIMHLVRLGFDLVVLPNVYLIHEHHMKSEDYNLFMTSKEYKT